MATAKGLLLVPNEAPTVKEFEIDFLSLKEVIGGWLEVIRVSDTAHMLVDEEGRVKNLPYNAIASGLCTQYIVGPAIIFGTVWTDDGMQEVHVEVDLVRTAEVTWAELSKQ